MTKFRDYPVLSLNTLAAVALAVPGIVALVGFFVGYHPMEWLGQLMAHALRHIA